MKISIYILFIFIVLIIPLETLGQTISYGCPEENNSEERILQVQLKALDPSGSVVTDQLSFDLPDDRNCFLFNEDNLEIYNQVNLSISINNPTNKSLHYLILVDWNSDNEYQLQSEVSEISEIAASGQTTEGVIEEKINPPNHLLQPQFISRARVIISDDPNELFAPNMSTSTEFLLRGSDPKVTISKDGNNLDTNPSEQCMPFNNYDQLVFKLENISSPNLNLNIEIENIILTDLTTNQHYTVNIVNDDELIVLDKITTTGSVCGTDIVCNVPYSVGQVFNMDNTDVIVLALAWETLRDRLPDLRSFPLNPDLYKATITVKIISHTTTTECLYIGCCEDTDVELTTETIKAQRPTWLPLYMGSAQEIQILNAGSGLIEVFDNFQSSIRSETFIRLGAGFHAQNGSFVHAYIGNCPTIPNNSNTNALVTTTNENTATLDVNIEPRINHDAIINIFPNPTSENTILEYQLEEPALVSLILLNTQGQPIKVILSNIPQTSGRHRVDLSTQNLTSGVYYYQLRFGQQEKVLKLIRK